MPQFEGVADERYVVRLAKDQREVESALRLRHEVFNIELAGRISEPQQAGLEFDAFDFTCRHLLVISKETGETVGTYRLNSIETARNARGFYSFSEFTIEDLPREVLRDGVEIGRACIAAEHRNTKVLFLLWKALLHYLKSSGKRYFFGCCSIFTVDEAAGELAFRQLILNDHFHDSFSVEPRQNGLLFNEGFLADGQMDLPSLFTMYLRIGARVCSPPMIDREFGTIDFFVVFDITALNPKYRKLFDV